MENKAWFVRRFGSVANLDKFIGWYKRALYQQGSILTGFLNPHDLALLKAVLGREIPWLASGGYPDSEKQRVLINPQGQANFKLSLLSVGYNARFNHLTHSQILGVLTHLGVQLSTFGDILTDGQGRWQIIVEAELADFFCQQIKRVGRTSVKVKIAPWAEMVVPADDHATRQVVAASLRLDGVLAKIGRQSRRLVKQALAAGEVQVDFMLPQRAEEAVAAGQTISWRHFGRIKIEKIAATRKGRYRIDYFLWSSHRR